MNRPVLGLSVAALSSFGCLAPLTTLTRTTMTTAGTAAFHIKTEPAATLDAERVRKAAQNAVPRLQRWGGLSGTITVKVAPDHTALERAVGRNGFHWLRALATYSELFLQSPQTWAGTDADLDEVMVHELTHCLLFRGIGTEKTWMRKGVPFWFREGMATVAADQGVRFPSLEDLARWLDGQPDLDHFDGAEELSKEAYEEAYGLAFHAMKFFLKRYRDQSLTDIIALMRGGDDFEGAFSRVTGLTPQRFETDFVHFLRFRGFRGYGLKVHPRDREQAP